MLARLALVATLALAACAGAPQPDVTSGVRDPQLAALPPMKVFTGTRAVPPLRSNAEMARDFLDLSFQLESGKSLPALSRFESPITVTVTPGAPPTLVPDLDRLLARLRSEAGMRITRVPSGPANITVQAVSRRELQRLVPQAACFVSPRVSSWAEFRATRRGAKADWSTLTVRDKMAIFIPADVAPQEIRDCLHEELAQALGPPDDLYRLPDSVFNDDNFNSILTGFDMLMLRVTYAPELASGMTRDQVEPLLPGILARYNPSGGRGGIAPPADTPRRWIDDIETALGGRAPGDRRRDAAAEAVAISQQMGWNDNRAAFSLYVLGRLSIAAQPDLALASFLSAGQIYHASRVYALQEAHVAMQLAAYALSSGDTQAVIRLADHALPVATQSENAALMAQLMLMKAAALRLANRPDEAEVVRQDGLAWARYGFGDDAEVRARAEEIAGLAPAEVQLAAK